jgi:hypothetical protein
MEPLVSLVPLGVFLLLALAFAPYVGKLLA